MQAVIFSDEEIQGDAMKAEFPIGTPTLHEDMANYREGYVCGYRMNPQWGDQVEVVNIEGDAVQASPPTIIRNHAAKARHDAIGVDEVAALVVSANASMEACFVSRRVEAERRKVASEAFAVELKQRIPAGYKGIVTATYQVDDSDSQSDHWGHQNTRTVVIGFTKTDRCLFGNMRKAAATWPEVAHLAENLACNEHRENYSMGGGMFLKAGSRHSTGWCIRFESVDYPPSSGEFQGGAA